MIVILICLFAFGFLFQFLGFLFQFSDPTMGIIIGIIIGVILAIPIAYYDKIKRKKRKLKAKAILEQQTTVICPRCKILVDINPGICRQCNQKV